MQATQSCDNEASASLSNAIGRGDFGSAMTALAARANPNVSASLQIPTFAGPNDEKCLNSQEASALIASIVRPELQSLVPLLLLAGADASMVCEHCGFNALHVAALLGDANITAQLLLAGADVRAFCAPQRQSSACPKTALQIAAAEGHVAVLRLLLARATSSPCSVNGSSESSAAAVPSLDDIHVAMELACSREEIPHDCTSLLVAHGADASLLPDSGSTHTIPFEALGEAIEFVFGSTRSAKKQPTKRCFDDATQVAILRDVSSHSSMWRDSIAAATRLWFGSASLFSSFEWKVEPFAAAIDPLLARALQYSPKLPVRLALPKDSGTTAAVFSSPVRGIENIRHLELVDALPTLATAGAFPSDNAVVSCALVPPTSAAGEQPCFIGSRSQRRISATSAVDAAAIRRLGQAFPSLIELRFEKKLSFTTGLIPDLAEHIPALQSLTFRGARLDRPEFFLQIDRLPELRVLDIQGAFTLSREALERITSLPLLHSLSLVPCVPEHTFLSDAELEPILQLPMIENLRLGGQYARQSIITQLHVLKSLVALHLDVQTLCDASVAAIATLPLSSFSLQIMAFGDAGLQHLSRMPKLVDLRLNVVLPEEGPSGAGFSTDGANLGRLRSAHLLFRTLTDDGFRKFASVAPNIRKVRVRDEAVVPTWRMFCQRAFKHPVDLGRL